MQTDLAFWRNLSIVLLCLEAFLICLVPAAAVYFIVRGMNVLLGRLPHYFGIVRNAFVQVEGLAWRITGAVATPICAVNAVYAQVAAVLAALQRLLAFRQEEL